MYNIKDYLDSKRNSWTSSTKRSEGYRLNALLPLLEQANFQPEAFYELLKPRYASYTIKTIFNRVGDFLAFYNNSSIKEYVRSNKNLFKYSYQFKFVDYSFEEAYEAIKKIKHEEVKKVCILMLTTGMRIHEALKYDGTGSVIGKGGKPRPIFSSDKTNGSISEATVRLYCKQVGLNPHDLRKLAATKLAASGLKEADLMHCMGWSNIQTASRYLQPLKQDELAIKVREALSVDSDSKRSYSNND